MERVRAVLSQGRVQVAAVIVLAAVLRVYRLAAESYWYDEVTFLRWTRLGPVELVLTFWSGVETNPPLYNLVVNVWHGLFGPSPASIRMVSVLFGVAAVAVVYLLGRELYDHRAGLVAALVMAVAGYQIRFSQEARMYTMLLFGAVLSYYCLVRLLDGDGLRWETGYVAATLFMLYTHYLGIFVVIAQGLYVVAMALRPGRVRDRFWRWAGTQLAVALLYLPWVPAIVAQRSSGWYSTVGKTVHPPSFLIELIMGFGGDHASLSPLLVGAGIGAVLVWGSTDGSDIAEVLGRRLYRHRQWTLLVLWLVVPLVLPYLASIVGDPFFDLPRHAITASAPLYLLAGAGIARAGDRRLYALLLAAIFLVAGVNLVGYHGEQDREDHDGAAAHITAVGEPGDLVLFSSDTVRAAFDIYAGTGFNATVYPPPDRDQEGPVWYSGRLDSLLSGRERVWYVASHGRDDRLLEELRGRFAEQQVDRSFADVTVYRFTVPDDSPGTAE